MDEQSEGLQIAKWRDEVFEIVAPGKVTYDREVSARVILDCEVPYNADITSRGL